VKHNTPKRLRLTVLRKNSECCIIKLQHKNHLLLYSYYLLNNKLTLRKSNNKSLKTFAEQFKMQLTRILKSIPEERFHSGLRLSIVLGVQQPKLNTKDDQLIVLNKTCTPTSIKQIAWYPTNDATAYSDGSYDNTKEKGGYAILIKHGNKEKIISKRTNLQGNNLIELHAVIQALRNLKKEQRIRVVTDSQYVIKGLVFWIEVWRRNRWYTASGEKARHKKQWLQLDKLTRNKIIELNWVKGHNNHKEHTLCDKLARNHLNQ
jgi:ribonuclease HI